MNEASDVARINAHYNWLATLMACSSAWLALRHDESDAAYLRGGVLLQQLETQAERHEGN
jgi:hypothetical protein